MTNACVLYILNYVALFFFNIVDFMTNACVLCILNYVVDDVRVLNERHQTAAVI